MARKSSGLESVARILILIDGILILVGAILALANGIDGSLGLVDVPGNNGFGSSALGLSGLVRIIIAIVIGVLYIMHFTGRFDMGEPLMNGIVFLILAILFGGLLTLIASILYIIAALT